MPRTVLRLEVAIDHDGSVTVDNERTAVYLADLLRKNGVTNVEVNEIREEHDKCGRLAAAPGYAPCTREWKHTGPCAHPLR